MSSCVLHEPQNILDTAAAPDGSGEESSGSSTNQVSNRHANAAVL
jgi:hypothetical protein